MTQLGKEWKYNCGLNCLVSWHSCTWVRFLTRCRIRTNKYISLAAELTELTEFWLIKHNFRTITWRISCYDFKTILIYWEVWKLMLLNVSITHLQLHIYGFSITVDLFGVQTYLRGEELVQRNRSNLQQFYAEVQIARLHQLICFYISFAFVTNIG